MSSGGGGIIPRRIGRQSYHGGAVSGAVSTPGSGRLEERDVHRVAGGGAVRESEDASTCELHYADRRYPGVAGRVDDFIVALRGGSTYILRLSGGRLWCGETMAFQITLAPGRYRVAGAVRGARRCGWLAGHARRGLAELLDGRGRIGSGFVRGASTLNIMRRHGRGSDENRL